MHTTMNAYIHTHLHKVMHVSEQILTTSLGECLLETKCTHVLTTPSLFGTLDSRFTPTSFPDLKVIALGGEVMPQRVVADWSTKVVLMNTYGVTECAVYQVRVHVLVRQ